jgi:predicted HicB family RNase H-like nuclease
MEKLSKFCSVRISENLHKKAKIKAIEDGLSLQKWMIKLMEEKLNPIKK